MNRRMRVLQTLALPLGYAATASDNIRDEAPAGQAPVRPVQGHPVLPAGYRAAPCREKRPELSMNSPWDGPDWRRDRNRTRDPAVARESTRVVKLSEPKASVDFAVSCLRWNPGMVSALAVCGPAGAAQGREARVHGIPAKESGRTLRYDRDLRGRPHRHLNAVPSKKALRKEREALRELTLPRLGFLPVRALIGRLNRHLLGWQNYFPPPMSD